MGLVHSRAIFWAAVGPRPRWVTLSHVDPVGDDQFEDRLAEHIPGDRDRDRADPGDFAQFLTRRPGRGAAPARRPATGPDTAGWSRPRRAPRGAKAALPVAPALAAKIPGSPAAAQYPARGHRRRPGQSGRPGRGLLLAAPFTGSAARPGGPHRPVQERGEQPARRRPSGSVRPAVRPRWHQPGGFSRCYRRQCRVRSGRLSRRRRGRRCRRYRRWHRLCRRPRGGPVRPVAGRSGRWRSRPGGSGRRRRRRRGVRAGPAARKRL